MIILMTMIIMTMIIKRKMIKCNNIDNTYGKDDIYNDDDNLELG